MFLSNGVGGGDGIVNEGSNFNSNDMRYLLIFFILLALLMLLYILYLIYKIKKLEYKVEELEAEKAKKKPIDELLK